MTVCGNGIGLLAEGSASCAAAAATPDPSPGTTTPGSTTPGSTTPPSNFTVPGGDDPVLPDFLDGAINPLFTGNLATTGTAVGLLALIGLLTVGAGRLTTLVSRVARHH